MIKNYSQRVLLRARTRPVEIDVETSTCVVVDGTQGVALSQKRQRHLRYYKYIDLWVEFGHVFHDCVPESGINYDTMSNVYARYLAMTSRRG